jgi:hypothetical protein
MTGVAGFERLPARPVRVCSIGGQFHPNDRGYAGSATVFADAIGISSTV